MYTLTYGVPLDGVLQVMCEAGIKNTSQSELPAWNVLPVIVMDAPHVAVKPNVVGLVWSLLQLSSVSGLVVPPQDATCGALAPPEFAFTSGAAMFTI